jgi:hypothetical protein
MSAMIDTGTSYTTLGTDAARFLFDLTPGSPGMKVFDTGSKGQGGEASYIHNFSNLSFEGVTVSNPIMVIAPRVTYLDAVDPQWGHLPRRANLPDVTIGMDILRTLHVYVAYKEHRLYITRADKAAASLLPPLADTQARPDTGL